MFSRRKKSISPSPSTPSISFQELPAKTYRNQEGCLQLGRSVFNHCQIVGHVALSLLNFFPENIRKTLFPDSSALIASIHDLGKVSPTFYLKLLRAINADWKNQHPFLVSLESLSESNWGGHAGVSALALEKLGYPKSIQTIAGQHHGFMPEVGLNDAEGEKFGGKPWQDERKALLSALEQEFKTTLSDIKLTDAKIRLLSGLTCVADWIGSGSFFDDPAISWQANIPKALAHAGYLPFQLRPNLSFESVFGFSTRPAQEMLIKVCDKSGVYILEAPMGLGKTEAALYCAYKMLDENKATGIYFALPTQLTSNKIYDRFNQFLSTILTADCPHRNALLLHGNAWLAEVEMGEEGLPGKSWFNSAKRGLLAPFAVGTLDQALMAAMNVKHGFVRAFGLAGKVVILDEVHSYDAYTSVILDRLITLLSELNCTVILLSATLNKKRKQDLLGVSLTANDYPLITAHQADQTNELSVPPPAAQNIQIKFEACEAKALDEAIDRAMQGEQILWIENTINEAQKRYDDFAAICAENNIECGLLHSRFTPEDRQINEARWVNALGKEGWKARKSCGRIIIGTQVLEQSLDIDADFLISRFAPSDMLLQRLGRLWRHSDTPRVSSAICEAWILAPTFDMAITNPQEAFGATAFVYSPYVLCRTLDAWEAHLASKACVSLPTDIRSLIDATYDERTESEAMQALQDELHHGSRNRKGLNVLRQLARTTLSKAGQTQSDTKAQTRYNEEDTSSIFIVKGIESDSKIGQTLITLLNGETIKLPLKLNALSNKNWRKLSCLLQKQMVPCRQSLLPQRISRKRARDLGFHHVFYLGNPHDDEIDFALAIQEIDGALKEFESTPSDKRHYEYRSDTGLRVIKID